MDKSNFLIRLAYLTPLEKDEETFDETAALQGPDPGYYVSIREEPDDEEKLFRAFVEVLWQQACEKNMRHMLVSTFERVKWRDEEIVTRSHRVVYGRMIVGDKLLSIDYRADPPRARLDDKHRNTHEFDFVSLDDAIFETHS